jgi:hypothetical protein
MINKYKMATRLVNGIKYIALLDDNNLKIKSFNDCVYYTLRDVFWNVYDEYYCQRANDLNALLVENKSDNSVKYTNALDDINYIRKIYGFLNSLNEKSFCFADEPFDDDETYIEYDIWWSNLETLIGNLKTTIIKNN